MEDPRPVYVSIYPGQAEELVCHMIMTTFASTGLEQVAAAHDDSTTASPPIRWLQLLLAAAEG